MSTSDLASQHLLPEVLAPVLLRLGRTTGHAVLAATRVLDIEVHDGRTYVVVACPAGCDPDEHQLEAQLSWTFPFGRVRRPVTGHPERRRYGQVWLLEAAGPAIRIQERRHFRAQMAVPVQLSWLAEEGADEADGLDHEEHREGITVDLSEGGFLAIVRDDPPPVGATVHTSMLVEGDELRCTAVVARHVAYPGGTGVAAEFPDPSPHADELRRAAFAAERRRVRAAR